MRVVFSNRAYASVLAETTEKIKTETGGLFLGTVQDDTWYIIEAIDPGPKSIFEVAYFEYDQKYTQHLINKIANLYDKKLDLIGLWHRHPGSFDQFSNTDDGTNAKYAAMRKKGAISALVNIDPIFRITMYQVDRPCRYCKIAYEVGDNLIPDSLLHFKSPENFLGIMDKMMNPNLHQNNNNEYHKSVSLASFLKFISPMLIDNEYEDEEINNLLSYPETQEKVIDEIIDDLTFMADSLGIETAISLNDNFLTVYQETVEDTIELHFMNSIKKSSIVMYYEDKQYIYHKGLLTEAFGNAKAAKDKNAHSNDAVTPKKTSSVIDTVIKMITFNKDEE